MYWSVINTRYKLLSLSAGLMCVELAAVLDGLCLLKPNDAPNVSTNWSHVSRSRRTRTVGPDPQIRPDCLHCYLQCSDSCIEAEHISSPSSVFHFDWIRSLWWSLWWFCSLGRNIWTFTVHLCWVSAVVLHRFLTGTHLDHRTIHFLLLRSSSVCLRRVSQSALLRNIQSESSRLCWGSWVM